MRFRLGLESRVIPLRRPARLLAAIAALSFAGILLLYAFPSHDRPTLSLVTDVCWIWASTYAAYCCFLAGRRITQPEERRTWQWLGAGCVGFLGGQLVWTYHDVLLGTPPAFPSLADVGYLSINVCFALGAPSPRARWYTSSCWSRCSMPAARCAG